MDEEKTKNCNEKETNSVTAEFSITLSKTDPIHRGKMGKDMEDFHNTISCLDQMENYRTAK